jgi:hypothetical protein
MIMNKIILERAIEQVRQILTPVNGICGICYRNKASILPDTPIEILDMPTKIGLHVCQSCFDNILIAAGEISQEY